MSNEIKVSCLQYTSLQNEHETLIKIEDLIKKAVKENSDIIALPECSTFICPNKENTSKNASFESDSLTLNTLKKLANLYKVNILVGSLQTKISKTNKHDYSLVNRSFFINSKGVVKIKYDKIHLFDVNLSKKEKFFESDTYTPGDKAVLGELNFGGKKIKLGLTICYDLRFPILYRDLAKEGAEIIFVPSAFSETTGEAHWHSLLKARAIENSCFIIAPAQTGKHFKGRNSFGHSLIVSPWGEVLADAKKNEGLITSKINIDEVYVCRKKIPSLKNEKKYKLNF